MTKEQIELKDTLENRESVLDNVAHDICDILKIVGNHEILTLYYDMRDLIQKEIKSKFPEGTEFDNF
jgi:transposase